MVFAAAAPANRAPVHRDRSCPHHQSHPHFCTLVEAEWHGLDAVEKIHDLTGTFAVTVLVIAIWISALALRSRPRPSAHFGFENLSAHLRAMAAVIPTTLQRAAAAVLIAGIFGVAIVQVVSAKIEARDQTQTAPFFSVRGSPSQTRVQLPRCLERAAPDQWRIYSHSRSAAGGWRGFSFFLETVAVESLRSRPSARHLYARRRLGKHRPTRIGQDRFFRASDTALSFSISARRG
jgi:hypothetical protein